MCPDPFSALALCCRCLASVDTSTGFLGLWQLVGSMRGIAGRKVGCVFHSHSPPSSAPLHPPLPASPSAPSLPCDWRLVMRLVMRLYSIRPQLLLRSLSLQPSLCRPGVVTAPTPRLLTGPGFPHHVLLISLQLAHVSVQSLFINFCLILM